MKKNESAFPGAYTYPYVGETVTDYKPGMTMRQWYKGQAIMGLMNTPGAIGINLLTIVEATADIADALLAEDEEHEEVTDER